MNSVKLLSILPAPFSAQVLKNKIFASFYYTDSSRGPSFLRGHPSKPSLYKQFEVTDIPPRLQEPGLIDSWWLRC